MRLCKFAFLQFVITIFFIILFVHSVFANNYYVSPNGTEKWPYCTAKDNPCKASNTDKDFLNAVAGDTVYFLDGTYSGLEAYGSYLVPAFSPQNSGTSSNPITFKSLNDKGAHLIGLAEMLYFGGDPEKPVGPIWTLVVGAYQKDYIIWDGFVISAVDEDGNSSKPCVSMRNTVGSQLKNCEIIGADHEYPNNENWDGVRIEAASDILVENCKIHGFRETSHQGMNVAGIKTYNVKNVTIRNCEITNNTGGIYFKGGKHENLVIENSWIHSNYRNLLMQAAWDNYYGVTIRNNVFSGAESVNFYRGGNETYVTNDILFYNNTVTGKEGFEWLKADMGQGPTIYNNIFYNLSSLSFKGRSDSFAPLVAEDHNRLDFQMGIALAYWGSEIPERRYTSLTSWQSSGELYGGGNPGTNSITDDPLFVNASGKLNQLQDFELSQNSPCRGVGRNGMDIGANVSEVGVGAKSNIALKGPLNLRVVEN